MTKKSKPAKNREASTIDPNSILTDAERERRRELRTRQARERRQRDIEAGIRPHSTREVRSLTSTPPRWARNAALRHINNTAELISFVQARLDDHAGEKSKLQWRAVAWAIQVLALTNQSLHITKTRDLLCNVQMIDQDLWRDLGLHRCTNGLASYDQIQNMLERVSDFMEQLHEDRADESDASIGLWWTNGFVAASRPKEFQRPQSTQALDSSDIAVWAATKWRWDSDEEKFKMHTPADPTARPGYSPSKNGRKGGPRMQHDIQVLCDAGDCPDESRYITGLALSLANAPKAAACMSMIRKHKVANPNFDTLTSDKGYVKSPHELWADELEAMGISQITDPTTATTPTENRITGFPNGAVIIDGQPFCPALPGGLRTPPLIPQKVGPEEAAAAAEPYETRQAWAFTLHERIADGSTRWTPPCRQNDTIRCVNYEPSLAQSTAVPTTDPDLVPDKANLPACCAQGTMTLQPVNFLGRRQKYPYGTNDWIHGYGQRNHVEYQNSLFKVHYYSWDRTKIRIRHVYGYAIMLPFVAAAVNILIARRWRERVDIIEPDPDPAVEADRTRRGYARRPAERIGLAPTRGRPRPTSKLKPKKTK